MKARACNAHVPVRVVLRIADIPCQHADLPVMMYLWEACSLCWHVTMRYRLHVHRGERSMQRKGYGTGFPHRQPKLALPVRH